MANRSYLYSTDFERSKGEKKTGDRILGLSEYAYEIPVSFRILVSQDSKVTLSNTWDYPHPIAIQGDFKKGRDLLFKFLEELSVQNSFDEDILAMHVETTKEFLMNKARELEFIILEGGEIFTMNEGQPEDHNEALFSDHILKIEEKMQDYLSDFKASRESILLLESKLNVLLKPKNFWDKLFSSDQSAEIDKLKNEIKNKHYTMWDTLGINNWSDTLYNSFDNEN